MHIPDGMIDPKFCGGLALAALAVVAGAFHHVRLSVVSLAKKFVLSGISNDNISLGNKAQIIRSYFTNIAIVTSLVFSLQMFNFPINSGTSGHLLGGMLATLLLGPFAGVLSISLVLIIQTLFFCDGGLFVLGANVVNMAFFGCLIPYYIYKVIKTGLGNLLAISVSGWLAVMLAAFFASLEMAFSGTYALGPTLKNMLGVHAIIGIGEAVITVVFYYLFRKALERLDGDV